MMYGTVPVRTVQYCTFLSVYGTAVELHLNWYLLGALRLLVSGFPFAYCCVQCLRFQFPDHISDIRPSLILEWIRFSLFDFFESSVQV